MFVLLSSSLFFVCLFVCFFFTFAVFFHVVYVKHEKGVVRRREVNIDIPIESRVDT